MNEFINTFSTYSNSELLKIVQKPEDYQPSAVEAAKINLDSRNLSVEEIDSANSELEKEQKDLELKKIEKEAFKNRARDAFEKVVAEIHPIQTSAPSVYKTIRVFSYVFGIVSIILVYNELGMIRFMFTSVLAKWDFSMVLYFLPVILAPTATILFYMRKKIGWTLFAFFLTYSSISAIYDFKIALQMQLSGFSAPFGLFPTSLSVVPILFFLGSLWVICKANIREVYTISPKTMRRTIGFVSTICLIVLFGLFKY